MSSCTSLHASARQGSFDAFQRELDAGKNINALEEQTTTTLMCAVAGPSQNIDTLDGSHVTQDRYAVIQHILQHPTTTVYTLNIPQPTYRGVTPLGMASWLNMPLLVSALLSSRPGAVQVDGVDTHGATPLMYAVRDSSLEVVRTLLLHGARPDFRDKNNCSSLQFALPHPQVLFMCEDAVRTYRSQESVSKHSRLRTSRGRIADYLDPSLAKADENLQPPPGAAFSKKTLLKATETFISCIQSGNPSVIRSVLSLPRPVSTRDAGATPSYPLSSPLLVNRPGRNGWSAIHHCVIASHPSIEILDVLYCAGADMGLFTTHEHYTPLHCIARFTRTDGTPEFIHRLYLFVSHLVDDLGAPLGSRAMEEETCLHVAAEHGQNADVLMILLELDKSGTVREMRNARGLTALEVARPEFRTAFGRHSEGMRSWSSLSQNTIRASPSCVSLVSLDLVNGAMCTDSEMQDASMRLLSNLRLTSPAVPHDSSEENLDHLDSLIEEAGQLAEFILRNFNHRSREVATALGYVQSSSDTVTGFSDKVSLLVDEELRIRGLKPLGREQKRDSDDSEATAVSRFSIDTADIRFMPDSSTLSSTSREQLPVVDLAEPVDEFGAWSPGSSAQTTPTKSTKTFRLKDWFKKSSGLFTVSGKQSKNTHPSASYIASTITSQAPSPLTSDDLNATLKQRDLFSKRQRVNSTAPAPVLSASDRLLQDSHFVFGAVNGDIEVINERLNSAQSLLDRSDHWISRADRTIKRALQARRSMVEKKRANLMKRLNDDLFLKPSRSPSSSPPSSPVSRRGSYVDLLVPRSRTISSQASIVSFSSVMSTASSMDPIVENDDEEARAIRRLILRKIDAGLDGAHDDILLLDSWLKILKMSVQTVKHQSFL